MLSRRSPSRGVFLLLALVIGIAAATGGDDSCGAGAGEGVTGTLSGGVPKKFVPIYQAAATKYRLGPKGSAMLASCPKPGLDMGTVAGGETCGSTVPPPIPGRGHGTLSGQLRLYRLSDLERWMESEMCPAPALSRS